MTADELHNAETAYEKAAAEATRWLDVRNAVIREALRLGWTHAQIAEATGLSRGRISQIKPQ